MSYGYHRLPPGSTRAELFRKMGVKMTLEEATVTVESFRSAFPELSELATPELASPELADATEPHEAWDVRSPVAAKPPEPPKVADTMLATARAQGYTGNVCDHCSGTRMQQTGHCETCADCGTTSGCS